MHTRTKAQRGMGRLALVALIFIGFVVLALGWTVYKSLTPPADRYAATGTFPDCPSRPSCVSSVDNDPVHAVAALRYCDDAEAAKERLVSALRAVSGFSTLEAEGPYLHAVYVTPTMRFRDDLELLLRDDGTIDVRSVSRVGYRDFGVNRERVEALRKRYLDAAPWADKGDDGASADCQ